MSDYRIDIQKSLDVLRNGGIILYPTDTIWGLGCDATNADAVKKIYALKQRTDNKSMIVLVDAPGRLYSYLDKVPEIALDLMELSEKPLTIIFEGAKNLADNVINKADQSVGVRVVRDPFCEQLIRQFKKPIVSTSANKSGNPSPAIFPEIDENIISQVDYTVTYRQDDLSKKNPSGIIKVSPNGEIKVIRE
jgi:L-threonylcarbamoyladenylate synthase